MWRYAALMATHAEPGHATGEWRDHYWWSGDGLRLHTRIYDPPAEAEADGALPPVLCLHGLTRNARDFELLAPYLSALGWRVIVPSMRGRGKANMPLTAAPMACRLILRMFSRCWKRKGSTVSFLSAHRWAG